MASNNKENAQNTVTINKTDANAFFKKAKLDLPFSFKPRMDSLVFKLTDEAVPNLVVGYLHQEVNRSAYKGFGYGDGKNTFQEFDTIEERDSYLQEMENADRISFLVDKQNDGDIRYSVVEPDAASERRFDEEPLAVYTPSEDYQHNLKVGNTSMATAAHDANMALKRYADYCNSFGLCIEEFELQRNGAFESVGKEAYSDMGSFNMAMQSMDGHLMEGLVDVPKYQPNRSVEAEDALTC